VHLGWTDDGSEQWLMLPVVELGRVSIFGVALGGETAAQQRRANKR
jgi:hypothetical protein